MHLPMMSPHFHRFLRRRQAGQRGMVHWLFLLFVVLGLTMWGATEMQFWARDRAAEQEDKTRTALAEARRGLINYAILQPRRLEPHRAQAGRYNALHINHEGFGSVADVPFRYFMLPCPDVGINYSASDRRFFDGVSDILAPRVNGAVTTYADAGCMTATTPGVPGSNYGRLPWRDSEVFAAGRQYTNVRGMGGKDFRDGYGERLWYLVSRNLVDWTGHPLGRYDSPPQALNPHALQRQTGGWYTAYDENNAVVADRIAAVVISPGTKGDSWNNASISAFRIPEEQIYPGIRTLQVVTQRVVTGTLTTTFSGGSVSLRVLYGNTLITQQVLAPAATILLADNLFWPQYLEPGSTARIGSRRLDIKISDLQSHDDRFSFLSIDDLVAEDSEGLRLLEEAPVNIYDRVSGTGELIGATEMLSAYLNRYGHLPAPALLHEDSAVRLYRPSGMPYNYGRGWFGSKGGTYTLYSSPGNPGRIIFVRDRLPSYAHVHKRTDARVAMPRISVRISELPRVYLLGPLSLSVHLPPTSITLIRPGEPKPPYGVEMAKMETFLNYVPLPEARRIQLRRNLHLPDVLGGLGGGNRSVVVANASNIDNTNSPLYTPPVVPPGVLAPGQTIVAVLSETAYGYFTDEQLFNIVDTDGGAAQLPPFAVKAMLPAGTRLTILNDDTSLIFPANWIASVGAVYNTVNGSWSVPSGGDALVKLIAGKNKWVEMEMPVDGSAARTGDVGFLPMQRAKSVGDEVHLPNSTVSIAGGVSRLAVDTPFRNGSDNLLLVPFPAPGNPGGYLGSLTLSPMRIPARIVFRAPAFSRLTYPPSSVTLGDSFAFPNQTRLQFAPGAVITAQLFREAVLPGGIPLHNRNPITREVTLVHGGVVHFTGDVGLEADGESFTDGKARQLFEMEAQWETRAVINNVTTTVYEDVVLNPFLGAWRRQALAEEIILPISIRTQTLNLVGGGAVTFTAYTAEPVTLVSDTYVEMRFAGMDRVAGGWEPNWRNRALFNQRVTLPAPYSNSVAISDAAGLLSNNITGRLFNAIGYVNAFNMMFDENTRFYLPPGTPIVVSPSRHVLYENRPGPRATATIWLAEKITVPAGSGFFRGGGMAPDLATISVDALSPGGGVILGRPKMVIVTKSFDITMVHRTNVYVSAVSVIGGVSVTIARARELVAYSPLQLLPRADMVYTAPGNLAGVIPADSVVNLMDGKVGRPSQWQRVAYVGEGAALRSPGAMYIGMPMESTLKMSLGANTVTTAGSLFFAAYAADTGFPSSPVHAGLPPTIPNYISYVTVQVALPKNVYFQVPPGEDVHFYPYADSPPDLPAGAVAVIPSAAQVTLSWTSYSITKSTVTTTVTSTRFVPTPGVPGAVQPVTDTVTSIVTSAVTSTRGVTQALSGPGYLFLPHGAPGLISIGGLPAITTRQNAVSPQEIYRTSPDNTPQLLLDDDAYLVANLPGRPRVHRAMAKQSRIDMLGNVLSRSGKGFYSSMLPQEARELFSNFPMVYAVAPECRLESGAPPGADCAQGRGEGLEFLLEPTEEYVLRAPHTLAHPALISAAAGNMEMLVYEMDGGRPLATVAVRAVQISANGAIGAIGTGTIASSLTMNLNNRQLRLAASGADKEVRVHMGTSAADLDLATEGLGTLGLSYIASSNQLTIYGGGYVKGYLDIATGGGTLTAGATIVYGYGAKLADILPGDEMFGRYSSGRVLFNNPVTISSRTYSDYVLNLSGYVYAGNRSSVLPASIRRDFLHLTLAAPLRNMDVYGQLHFSERAGQLWRVSIGGDFSAADLPHFTDSSPTLTIADGAVIRMPKGYLWQGYVPSDSQFEIARRANAVVYNKAYANWNFYARIGSSGTGSRRGGEKRAINFPDFEIRLRIHPTVNQLNLWGSGLERPESIDRAARNYLQQKSPASTVAFFGFGSGRHTRHTGLKYEEAGSRGNYIPIGTHRDSWELYQQYAIGHSRDSSTMGVQAFARLMNGNLIGNKHVNSVPLAVAVHYGGSIRVTVAQWSPMVKVEYTLAANPGERFNAAVGGFVRVNSGSSSPTRVSAAITSSIRVTLVRTPTLMSSYTDVSNTITLSSTVHYSGWHTLSADIRVANNATTTLSYLTVEYLPYEWMGRHNTREANLREDAVIRGFQCGNTPATAIFNMPHIDIAGTGQKYQAWPGTEHSQAHLNALAHAGQYAPVSPGALDTRVDDRFTAISPKLTNATLSRPAVHQTLASLLMTVTGSGTNRVTFRYSDGMPEVTVGIANARAFRPRYNRGVGANEVISLDMMSDWFFYMDPVYHASGGVPISPLPAAEFTVGTGFRIRGPAAIVPPFGGRTRDTTKAVYAERSYFLNKMLPGLLPLHELYDQWSGDCLSVAASTNDCSAMHKQPYWFPMVGGIISFNGLEVKFTDRGAGASAVTPPGNARLRMIQPMPQMEVTLEDGSTTVLYSGSMLFPHSGLVIAAKKLEEAVIDNQGGSKVTLRNHTLYSRGEIIAHVDVSPVHREVNYEIRAPMQQFFDGGIFNYAPTRAGSAAALSGDCIVEPLGFHTTGPMFDFNLRAVAQQTPPTPGYTDGRGNEPEDSALCEALIIGTPVIGGAPTYQQGITNYMGCWQVPEYPTSAVSLDITTNPSSISTEIRQVPQTNAAGITTGFTNVRVDHTVYFPITLRQRHRDSQSPLWYRYGVHWGGQLDTEEDFGDPFDSRFSYTPPSLRFARDAARSYTHVPIRVDGSFARGAIANSAGADLIAKLHRGVASLYRDSRIRKPGGGHFVDNRFLVYRHRGTMTAEVVDWREADIDNTDVRFGNPASYFWQRTPDSAVFTSSLTVTAVREVIGMTEIDGWDSTTMLLRRSNDGSEIDTMRLPHRIVIPESAPPMVLGIFTPFRYPDSTGDFFAFPTGTRADILNLDLNSWLSSHPYFGVYEQGLVIRPGKTNLNTSSTLQADLDALSRISYTVGARNDSYYTKTLSGMRVVHYQKSESSQWRHPFSNVPIHTNVWLRLPQGGEIRGPTSTIVLGPDSLVNPIHNTYLALAPPPPTLTLSPHGDVRRDDVALNAYRTNAVVQQAFRIIRPALVLPPGTRLVAGRASAVIRNVQAAAMFSLTPLDAVLCPTGDYSGADGMQGAPLLINQKLEGVSENVYRSGNRRFGFGNPCAWLDDPENTDGDRTYIYRHRRRYVDEDVRIRTLSNDRTYLVGGVLQVNDIPLPPPTNP